MNTEQNAMTEACDALLASIPDSVALGQVSELKGSVRVPPSKSYTHRAIMIGGLGEKCTVEDPLVCADTTATVRLWEKLGASIDYSPGLLNISGIDGSICVEADEVNVGEAGTLLRIALPGLAQNDRAISIVGEGTLRTRPNSSVVEPLRRLGVDIEGVSPNDTLPLRIGGTGQITCGNIRIEGGSSSQAISAFLLWAPTFLKAGNSNVSTITVEGDIVSAPYIEITLDVLKWAGIEIENDGLSRFTVPADQKFQTDGKTYRVGGDYSSAAFLLAAGALIDSEITLEGLLDDRQGDRAVLDIMRQMGVKIERVGDSVVVNGPAALKGVDVDCRNTPDLVPVLTALACFAEGTSRFRNVGHLRIKESNRIEAPAEELRKLGASVTLGETEIKVEPRKLRPASVSSHNDHRLAMALMVAGLRLPGLTVDGVPSIAKSYPTFLNDMRALGADIS